MKKLMLFMVLVVCSTLSYSQTKAKVTTKTTATGTTHSVSLSCTASTSTGVTGYNFYRGTTAGGESATALNASPVSTCAYTDNAVNANTTYFYTAKAFCSVCSTTLSGPSNEVSAVIPADPQPLPPTMNPPTVQ